MTWTRTTELTPWRSCRMSHRPALSLDALDIPEVPDFDFTEAPVP